MGPLLFAIYVNDLYLALGRLYFDVGRAQIQRNPNQALLWFADDTCLTVAARTESGLLTMTRGSMSRKEK